MKDENTVRSYLQLVTGAFMIPTYGINEKELIKFTERLIEDGIIDCEDSQDALDEYTIPIFLAYLLSNHTISYMQFNSLIKGCDFKTANMKDSYKELQGIKINNQEIGGKSNE